MADQPQPPAPSKTNVFVRRSSSTLFLWGLVAVIFVSRWSWAYLALIGVLAIIATVELFRMFREADVKCFPRFGILTCIAYIGSHCFYFLNGELPPADIDFMAIFVVIVGAFTLQLRDRITGVESLFAIASNVLAFIYIAFLFNFLARLTFMFSKGGETSGTVGEQGAFVLLWLIAVTKFTDMGAYVTGSLLGRHKMIPHVSPGKTWEGFGGALFFSQLAACGLYAAFPSQLSFFKGYPHVIVLGFLLAVLAVIGDLAESVVKRALNAKDSGRMLPGIGGSLDLIDSICFTAPALYFYLKWFLLPAA
ncbi:MAG: CDP-archaeol synthase [Gloeobacteraceae cyanobacterium ES-bin-144]|nr:CDP-archaeol synthase [Verrucomicrobiales bacterium]